MSSFLLHGLLVGPPWRVRLATRLWTALVGVFLLGFTVKPAALATPAEPSTAAPDGTSRSNSAVRTPTNRLSLVVLGDSLAAGYGVDPAEAYPGVLQRQIDGAGLNYRVVNAGVSGDTSAGALRRIDWLLRRPVDVLLIEIGGNDGLRGQSPGALKTNLVTIIERTRHKQPQARIVLVGMKMPPNMGAYAEQFETVFAEVAREQETAFVPHLLEGVGGVPEMNQPDGIHPSPEGHRRVATNVWTVLEPILRKPAHPAP